MRWHTNFEWKLAGLLFLAVAAAAQVTVGDNLNLNLSGDLSFGFSGSYGENALSSHGLNIGGQGQFGGFYYNPNFLSFNVQPYYNRSQNNSSSQSISDSSGFRSQVNLFQGSHFPGSVAFDKTFDSSGQFGFPGIAGFTSHGGGRSFGITWNALLPHWPTLTASYATSAEHSEVYGASGNNESSVRNLNLQSYYSIAGFRLNGMFTHQSQDATFPLLLTGEPETSSNFGSDSISLQGSHKIPLNGEWNAGVIHSSYSGDVSSGTNTGTNDGSNNIYNTGLTISPVRKLSLSFTTDYNTNVYATLQQQILQADGTFFEQNREWSAKALSLNSFAFYTLTSHISVTGNWGHQVEYLPEGDRSASRYGGSVNFNYAHSFLGSLNFSVGAVDLANEQGNQGGGLIGNVNFSRRLRGWEVGAGFNYSQYVQTLLVTSTLSTYNYSASVRRRFRNGMYWNGSFLASHSGLTQTAGTSNHAESVTTSFIYGRYNLNGMYSQSDGTAILTSGGLVPVPTGVPGDLTSQQYQYGAKSFGLGAGAAIKRAVWTINYTKSHGDALSGLSQSIFESRSLNARLQYRVRKMYFNAGFTRFQQTFGVAGSLPVDVNTYFVGFTRWFNVF
ncbi:MAG: hypothetical protein LAO09_14305 [Acidobacteriia bacterium]|nr:hypothetical protein [Terriglobia bacterium]